MYGANGYVFVIKTELSVYYNVSLVLYRALGIFLLFVHYVF